MTQAVDRSADEDRMKKKLIGEAGAWHPVLLPELRKKQDGGEYHRQLVTCALRHIQRHCSGEAYTYYMNLHDGHEQLPPC